MVMYIVQRAFIVFFYRHLHLRQIVFCFPVRQFTKALVMSQTYGSKRRYFCFSDLSKTFILSSAGNKSTILYPDRRYTSIQIKDKCSQTTFCYLNVQQKKIRQCDIERSVCKRYFLCINYHFPPPPRENHCFLSSFVLHHHVLFIYLPYYFVSLLFFSYTQSIRPMVLNSFQAFDHQFPILNLLIFQQR